MHIHPLALLSALLSPSAVAAPVKKPPAKALYTNIKTEYPLLSTGGPCVQWRIEPEIPGWLVHPVCLRWDITLPAQDYILRRVSTRRVIPCEKFRLAQSKDLVVVEPVCDVLENVGYKPKHRNIQQDWLLPEGLHPENPEPRKEKGKGKGKGKGSGKEKGKPGN